MGARSHHRSFVGCAIREGVKCVEVPDGDTPDSVIDHHLSLATAVPRRFLVRRVLPALRSSLRCE